MIDRVRLDLTSTWVATMFGGVWRNVVWRQHEMGVLNSERALQACIVGAFASLAPEIVVLVEPQLSTRGIIPDLWIGMPSSGQALVVVELKYVPDHLPVWEKDLQSLTTLLASERTAHDTDPATGRPKQPMACTAQTLGIFAAVGRHDAAAVDRADVAQRLGAPGNTYSDAQRATFPRLLHARGSIGGSGGLAMFDMDWMVATDDDGN
jgi:hypothetical protein